MPADKDEEKEYQYSEKYDAYYDAETNQWIDSKCSDPNCEFCVNRPERPLPEKDPVHHCKLYREEGCSHVDGYLCKYSTCEIRIEYERNKKWNVIKSM